MCDREDQKLSKFTTSRSNASGLAIIKLQRENITPYHGRSNMQVTFNATIKAISGSAVNYNHYNQRHKKKNGRHKPNPWNDTS